MLVRYQSGQILILVLLVVVVALAVGLSIASRNITNLRTSTQTEQSQRAFTAAEGGIEDVLSRLDSVRPSIVGETTLPPVTVGDLQAEVTIRSTDIYQTVIDLGSVGQADIGSVVSGTPAAAYKIQWAQPGELEAGTNLPASIEVTQYSYSGTQDRRYYVGGGRGGVEQGGPVLTLSNPSNCPVDSGFTRCTIVPKLADASILRIRPFWVRTTVKFESGDSGKIPIQSYDVSSVAQTPNGVTRRVQVQRTALPQLPAVFDYVLYSNGNISR